VLAREQSEPMYVFCITDQTIDPSRAPFDKLTCQIDPFPDTHFAQILCRDDYMCGIASSYVVMILSTNPIACIGHLTQVNVIQ
jgi:hypothetical protein